MAFAPTSPFALDGMPKFFSFVYHQYVSSAIFTFAELGIADRLASAQSSEGLTAQEIVGDDRPDWNSEMLFRVLRSCADVGVVERTKGTDDAAQERFRLTSAGLMLTSSHPSHARDLVRAYLGPSAHSLRDQLPDLVRDRNVDANKVRGGVDFFTFICQPENRQALQIIDGAMSAWSVYTNEKLATAVDFGRFATVVDVGGAQGTFLREILQHHAQIERGIVFDLPPVIANASSANAVSAATDRISNISFVAGNMFLSTEIPPADAYILKHILHDYGDEQAIAILNAIRVSNEKRASAITVFIVEHIILPDGALCNWQCHAFDIAMAAALPKARERTSGEYEQLLKQAGFTLKRLYPVQAPNSIIEAAL